MRHHSCTRAAGVGSVDFSISTGSMSCSSVWDILSGCSLPALPSCSLSDPAPSVSPFHLQISEPNHSPAPQPSIHPLDRKPAWGPSFLTHNDLSIWGEVIHLACACGLHFSGFISTFLAPSLPPALVAVSHDFAAVGFRGVGAELISTRLV